jgi:hypothetical protein
MGLQSQTFKGGLLILAAVIVGIVLLQIVDPGKSASVAGRPPARTTTTTARNSHTTTTTKKPTSTNTTAVKTPAQVRLLVLNAGAPTGSAASASATLRGKGYTNQGSPGNDPRPITGKEVLCLPALTHERAALAVLLGTGTIQANISNGIPPGGAGYDCVVLVGG